MKAQQLIKLLEEVVPDTLVYCLLYLPEDAEIILDSEAQLTKEEWKNVVEKMENNDYVDEEVNAQFREYVFGQIEKGTKVNANQ